MRNASNRAQCRLVSSKFRFCHFLGFRMQQKTLRKGTTARCRCWQRLRRWDRRLPLRSEETLQYHCSGPAGGNTMSACQWTSLFYIWRFLVLACSDLYFCFVNYQLLAQRTLTLFLEKYVLIIMTIILSFLLHLSLQVYTQKHKNGGKKDNSTTKKQ